MIASRFRLPYFSQGCSMGLTWHGALQQVRPGEREEGFEKIAIFPRYS